MPDVWLPGAHIDPGQNAGYNAGRNSMQRAIAHYTVGEDSRAIGRDGYFHWLIHQDASRENGCTQYAEIDAVTWHGANVGNPYGPGIEYERMTTGGVNDEGLSNAEPLTDNQVDWGARIVDFCAEWGMPVLMYDGAPAAYGNWNGWVNHHDLDPVNRSDGLLRAEWDLICGGARPEPEEEEVAKSTLCASLENPGWGIYLTDGIGRTHLQRPAQVEELVAKGIVASGDIVQLTAEAFTALIDYDAVYNLNR
jgi:hypothetical protein